MILQWEMEEKILLNLKKGIADGWRMNSLQLNEYCRRLHRVQERALPGYLGCAFVNEVRRLADGQTEISWPKLAKDVEKIQKLIQSSRQWDSSVWLDRLPVLKARRKQYFYTELGEAWIQLLQEKLGLEASPAKNVQTTGQRMIEKDIQERNIQQNAVKSADASELEQLAVWLMEDTEKTQTVKSKQRRQPRYVIKPPDGAAAFLCACVSLCMLTAWLYGQVERNQSFQDIQRLKASAITQQNYSEKRQETDTQTTGYTDSQKIGNAAKGGNSNSPAVTERTEDQGSKRRSAQKQTTQNHTPEYTKRPEILPQYQEMAKEYPGLFGWLQIPDTQIDLPVMQPFKEKDFYLDHDFTGAPSAEGALFTDLKNSCWPQDGNTVIYGHNMKNGHLFGELDLYENEDYFQAHKEIHFDTIYETGLYEAVAVVKTRILNENEPGFRYYQFFQYENKEEFQKCLEFVEKNQMFETGGALQYGDIILMLSTCEYSQENGRLVLVARKTGPVE